MKNLAIVVILVSLVAQISVSAAIAAQWRHSAALCTCGAVTTGDVRDAACTISVRDNLTRRRRRARDRGPDTDKNHTICHVTADRDVFLLSLQIGRTVCRFIHSLQVTGTDRRVEVFEAHVHLIHVLDSQ